MSDGESGRAVALTNRRGFVVGAGLSIVSVYGVWAAYDAAPLYPGASEAAGRGDAGTELGSGASELAAADQGHAGHGGAPDGKAEAIEMFRREAEAFRARHRRADGSVAVLPPAAGAHAGHGTPDALDVYLAVQQWWFEPAALSLARDQLYRFRMMAMDVAHGASIQAGAGSVIVRLRPGTTVEREIAFRRAGRYLVYCTTYCGPPHDRMFATVTVA